MMLSTLHLYFDVLMHHSIELMGEADHWLESAKEHLRSAWTHVDVMVAILPLPDLPVSEMCAHIAGLRRDLDILERFDLTEKAIWHVQVLRSSLDYILQVLEEHGASCRYQPVVIDSAY